MKIQLTGNLRPEEDPSIIVHGKIPQAPQRSCQTCALIDSCMLLSDAMKSLQVIGPMPKVDRPIRMRTLSGEILEDTNPYGIMPLPMPCQGRTWTPKTSGVFEQNPLVQRLGLTDVVNATDFFDTEQENHSR